MACIDIGIWVAPLSYWWHAGTKSPYDPPIVVTEKTAKNRMVYGMQAVNYSHMYYLGDALTLWIMPMPFPAM